MKFEVFYKTIYKELHHRGFNVTLSGVREHLLRHAYYPSLQSVSDYFTDMNIPNIIVRIDMDQLRKSVSEANAIVLVKDEDGDNLLWIKNVTDKEIIYENASSETIDSFRQKWNGVTLLLQIEDIATEDKYEVFKYEQNRNRIFVSILLIGFLLIGVYLGLSSKIGIDDLCLLLPKLGGLVFVVLLLSMDLGINLSLRDKFCSLSSNHGCEKVSYSKASSIFGEVKLSDLGLIYFSTVLIYWFVMDEFLLAYISLLCIPMILFSLSYQWLKLRLYCPLCLGVMLMLALDILAYWGFDKFVPLDNCWLFIEQLLLFGGVWFLVGGSWLLLKQLIKSKNVGMGYKYQYYHLLRNPERIKNVLDGLKEEEIPTTGNEIVLGDKDGHIIFSEFINPFCSPCGNSMKMINRLLNIYESGLQFRLYFVSKVNNKEKNDRVILHLLSFARENDSNTFLAALLDWYKILDYEEWSKKYAVKAKLSKDDVEDYLQKIKKVEVFHTPTLFVNNRRLPDNLFLYHLRDYIEEEVHLL